GELRIAQTAPIGQPVLGPVFIARHLVDAAEVSFQNSEIHAAQEACDAVTAEIGVNILPAFKHELLWEP
ncbi:MAG TPA: hypothetical protein VEA98_05890, partial [Brevundimonas sp.]